MHAVLHALSIAGSMTWDQLAADWDTTRATVRDDPLHDALARVSASNIAPCPRRCSATSVRSTGRHRSVRAQQRIDEVEQFVPARGQAVE